MKIERRWFWAPIILVLPLLFVFNRVSASQDTVIRWDLTNVTGGGITPGGSASALANDGDPITITGSGTFTLGEREEVTGGGTWTDVFGSGTFQVTQLIRFDLPSGGFPPGVNDTIADSSTARPGLAVLRVKYSNGERGILFVSCNLPGAPDSVFEGITASKGFRDYWNRVAPVPGQEGNRTLFHIISGQALPDPAAP
jgi:hypothetical protein